MDTLDPTAPDHAPSAAYRHLFLALCAAIPPVDDTPLAAERRDQAAIAQVAGLCPANMAEAMLAAQYAAANAQALKCLALMRQDPTPGNDADRLATLANTMMRRAEGALANLIRLQTMRGKRDADATAANHAAWIEHAVTAWMQGEGGSHETRHDPDHRDHETPMTPSPQADPARPAAPPPDPSHHTTHRPDQRFHETPMIPPMPPANPAAETGPSRIALGDSSLTTIHHPVDRVHETTMTHADPPRARAPAHRDTPLAAPIPRAGVGAAREAERRDRDGEDVAIPRRFPHPYAALATITAARSSMGRAASSGNGPTITSG